MDDALFSEEMNRPMEATVILLWERRRLGGLVAEVAGGRARVHHSFSIPWADDSDPLQFPTKSADALRAAVSQSRAESKRTIVCLAREDVILRHLTVPDVPDDELPDLVRFQAAARSTLSLDQLLLDFLPLPKIAGHEGRPVLAVTAPKSLVQGIQSIVQAAGLEPAAAVTFSSIGLAELLTQRNEAATALGVFREGPRVELVVLADRKLLYAHSARLATDDDGATPVAGLLAEVSRTVVAAQRLHSNLKVQQAYLVDRDADAEAVLTGLTERLSVPAKLLELSRFSGVEFPQADWPKQPAADAALMGLLLAETRRQTPGFDFLHPRQPPAKVNPRKIQIAVGSAAALLLATLIFGGVEGRRGSLNRKLEELRSAESALDMTINSNKTVLAAAKLVDDWQNGNVNQISQFTELADLMEGTERMYLSQYNFAAGQGEIRGTIQAQGNSKSRDDVPLLNQRMSDTKKYRIIPKQLTQAGRDDEYPNRFELQADILPAPKAVPQAVPKTDTKK